MKIYKKIFKMLSKRQKFNFVIIIFIMIISSLLTQLLPLSIGNLTDNILAQEELSFLNIIPFLAFILVVTVSNEIIKVIRRLLVEDTSTRFEKEARSRAISAILHAPLDYFKKNMTGNIHGKLNRSLEGTTRLLKLMFMDFAPAIFNGIAAIVVIFSKLPLVLALLMLLVIPIGIIIVFRQISTQRGIRVELMNEKSNMDGVMVELINGIEVIRVVDSSDQEIKRFDHKSEYLRQKEMKHHRSMAFYDCLKFINEAVFTVLVIGVSSYLAGEKVITVGTVLTAYLCFTQLTTPLRELHRIFDELSESTVLAEEYFRIASLPKDFSYQVGKKLILKEKNIPIIAIKNLTFRYGEKDQVVIDDLNLEIKRGQFIGIAGPSGCGKSSLIKVLTKLEKAEGDVYLEGVSIQSLNRADIAKKIALVPQTPFLISASIRENVSYGLDYEVSLDEIKEACRKAFIDDFIESLPDKYETVIAEGGGNLSGGQRQRIAIARIFLRKPSILILDEATSALDNTTEKHIQKAIELLQKENSVTIISIAHRLSTLENCDNILVFDKGKIIQMGKYHELINTPGIFQDMYNGILK